MKTAYVVPCSCPNEFQDAQYGRGRRVSNLTAKGSAVSTEAETRCTSCGTVHRVKFSGARPKKRTGTGSGGARSYVAHPPVTGWPGGFPEHNGWHPIGSK